MGLFVLIGRDGPQGAALRAVHREAHLAKWKPLADAGGVVYAGPLLEPAETPCGSVIVFAAHRLEDARQIAAADPYVVHGIFERWEVRGTRQVFPEPGC